MKSYMLYLVGVLLFGVALVFGVVGDWAWCNFALINLMGYIMVVALWKKQLPTSPPPDEDVIPKLRHILAQLEMKEDLTSRDRQLIKKLQDAVWSGGCYMKGTPEAKAKEAAAVAAVEEAHEYW